MILISAPKSQLKLWRAEQVGGLSSRLAALLSQLLLDPWRQHVKCRCALACIW